MDGFDSGKATIRKILLAIAIMMAITAAFALAQGLLDVTLLGGAIAGGCMFVRQRCLRVPLSRRGASRRFVAGACLGWWRILAEHVRPRCTPTWQ